MNDITIYTLQINDSGSWRNIVKGTKDQMQAIEHHVEFIARAIGGRHKWRIVDLPLMHVVGYCESPDFEWRPAGRN